MRWAGGRSGTSRSAIRALGYSLTMAPLAVKDKILVGVGGGEYGIRGFVAAFSPDSGKELWRFYTVPGPGERGNETWKGDAWKTGGGSVWLTPSYDPALNLTYWGIGNPGPDWNADLRPGDNLFTDSVIALDADTGALKWHFQFTPNDTYDYDSVQVAVLADIDWRGTPTKDDALGQPQRLLLRPQPRDRRLPLRRAVREGELGQRSRCQGPADSHAAAARTAHVARQSGRHQLVLAVVQPAHRALLRVGVGRLRVDLPQGAGHLHPGAQLRRRRPHRADAGARRARPRIGRYNPINEWTDVVGHGA